MIDIILSIAFGLLAAGSTIVYGYWKLVREPERLRYRSEIRRAFRNERQWQKMALGIIDRGLMQQQLDPLSSDMVQNSVDAKRNDADYDASDLSQLPQEKLEERLRQIENPVAFSDGPYSERRQLAAEVERRRRNPTSTLADLPDEDELDNEPNELSAEMIQHLTN